MTTVRTTLLAGACVVTLLAVAAVTSRRAFHPPAGIHASDVRQSECVALRQNGIELAGVVNGRDAQAYFDMAAVSGAPEGLSGSVLFPRDRTNTPLADMPIGLSGARGADACTAELTEHERDTDATWSLRIEDSARVAGQRRTPDGSAESILFTIVPKTSCDGAGAWRTFSAPDWPIAFDYPAAWVITADGDDIALECPSVAQLASGGSWLSFEQGRFPPRDATVPATAGEPYTEPFWFSRMEDSAWIVDDQVCGRPSADAGDACTPARRTERNGITILQGAAGDHRLYRPGVGDLGPGHGITRYLFITGERWVSLDMALADSHHEDVGAGGGPVLLDGNGVGDRLIRTIRRR